MKAILFEQFGEPAEVLQVRDVPEPQPGPGQVRVRMIASPINPSDLLLTRGRYGFRPELPARVGFEGVGVVEAVGPGPLGLYLKGKRVAVLNQQGGNWAEKVVIPAKRAVPVSSRLADEQVASFFVNPATVLAMVRHVLAVPTGGWLVQSAANSVLGRMIIRLGRHDGFKTINIVRRPELIEELRQLGGDAVLCSQNGPIDEQVRAITGGDGALHALDAVGGDIGTGVFNSLGSGGRMLVYGTLSGEPIRVDPRQMISGRRVVEGFYLGYWAQDRGILKMLKLFRQIAGLIDQGVLATPKGSKFPLVEVADAVQQAELVGRGGKVLLTMSS